MSDLIKNLESAIENGNEKYGFVDMLLLVNCRNEISRLQGIINKALRQQPEPDKVMISRECALEALHAMQNDQARPDFQCGELNEAIDQLKQALENEQ